MGSFRIASRYAKSLIDLAREKGQLESVHADVVLVQSTLQASRELKSVMKSPIIASDKKLGLLAALFRAQTGPLLYQFMELLVKKGREAFLPEVLSSFQEQYNRHKGITVVKISSAVVFDEAQTAALVNGLKSAAGLHEVELHKTTDESLIGGFVVQYGDKMIDASVKRKIHELRQLIEDDSYIKKF